jgi:glycyl-tRNA synthetase alpha chain
MYLQNIDSVFNLKWDGKYTYGDVYLESEKQFSIYNFEKADVDMLFKLFAMYESECKKLIQYNLVLPAYDFCLKCSHTFNLLDARGAISVSERTSWLGRVRALAKLLAQEYQKSLMQQ